jgi:hypothetical protein
VPVGSEVKVIILCNPFPYSIRKKKKKNLQLLSCNIYFIVFHWQK